MFVDLLAFYRVCTCVPLLNIGLKGSNLFVYMRYVLLDNESKFLRERVEHSKWLEGQIRDIR